MHDFYSILHGLTVALLGVGVFALFLLRSGAEAAVKKAAEEAASATIRQLQWPAELAREMQKTRGIERQELRYKSYGALWAKLAPLAIYSDAPIDRRSVRELSARLSDWYFSEAGGLLLTPQARDFYFAFQDLLRVTGHLADNWVAERDNSDGDALRANFRALLEQQRDAKPGLKVLDRLAADDALAWPREAAELGKDWKATVHALSADWPRLSDVQHYTCLQQVASALRTCLVTDLESRAR